MSSYDHWTTWDAVDQLSIAERGGVAPLWHEVALADYLRKKRTCQQAATVDIDVLALLHRIGAAVRAAFQVMSRSVRRRDANAELLALHPRGRG
jgi:hypothetical protein